MTRTEYRAFQHYRNLMEEGFTIMTSAEYPNLLAELTEEQECELLSGYTGDENVS